MNKKTIQPLKQLEVFGDILDKPIWGPVFWILFHKQSKIGFTEEWLNQFTESIICPDCKDHFIQLLERFPIKIFKDHQVWGWLLHNMVNTEQANKQFFSWEEYKRKYK